MTKGLKRAAKPLYDAIGDNQTRTAAGSVPSAVSGPVTVEEMGTDAMRRTRFTLTDLPISVVSVTTGNGVGGTQIYDFPEGYIQRMGCVANLSVSIATASQADFTDATPEGDMGVGTVAPANADALGTDATDDDFATATAFVMSAYADSAVDLPSEAAALVDGSATAVNLFVNFLVDAADIDDDATTEVLVSGTIDVVWSLIGDV